MQGLADCPPPKHHRALANSDLRVVVHIGQCLEESIALLLQTQYAQGTQDTRDAEMIVIHPNAPILGTLLEVGSTHDAEAGGIFIKSE